jgi:hypothetical protein
MFEEMSVPGRKYGWFYMILDDLYVLYDFGWGYLMLYMILYGVI